MHTHAHNTHTHAHGTDRNKETVIVVGDVKKRCANRASAQGTVAQQRYKIDFGLEKIGTDGHVVKVTAGRHGRWLTLRKPSTRP
jgi:hypothetical protein